MKPSQGDPPARLQEIRANLTAEMQAKQAQVWVALPFGTPLG